MEALRWPDGPRCPGCGSGEVVGSSQRRRCRACRLPFRWSTRTALHATKLPADAWMRAACLERPDPAAVAAELGCSAPTARRVASLLRGTGLPAGSGEARLTALLAQSPEPPRRSRRPGLGSGGCRAAAEAGARGGVAVAGREAGDQCAASEGLWCHRPCCLGAQRVVGRSYPAVPATHRAARLGSLRDHGEVLGLRDDASADVAAHMERQLRGDARPGSSRADRRSATPVQRHGAARVLVQLLVRHPRRQADNQLQRAPDRGDAHRRARPPRRGCGRWPSCRSKCCNNAANCEAATEAETPPT